MATTSGTALLARALGFFRAKRMRRFLRTLRVTENTRVLDVGGSLEIWAYSEIRPELTILNLPSALDATQKGVSQVAGDGLALPFGDLQFDVAFSNSVIEHLGSAANQLQFANEITRVARSFWVQTPNRKFPVEQHLMLPGLHLLPNKLQQRIVNRFTVWEFLARPTEAQRSFYVNHYLNDVQLLDARELQSLFPGSEILTERFFGMAKSLVAVRAAGGFDPGA